MWSPGQLLWMALLFLSQAHSKRVLFMPYQWPSHVQELYTIASYIEARHEVYVLVSETVPDRENIQEKFPSIKTLIFKSKETDLFQMEQPDMEGFYDTLVSTPIKTSYRTMSGPSAVFCRNMLSDADLLQEVRELRFDLAVVDSIPPTECMHVLPYKFDIPTIGYAAAHNPWLSGNPALPSFSPYQFTDMTEISDDMSFAQRLQNFWDMIHFNAFQYRAPGDDSFVTTYAPEKQFKSLRTLISENIIWLLATDILLDFPLPRMPNEIDIGGHKVSTVNKAIPDDLEQFMKKHNDGIIVAAFGGTHFIPTRYFDRILEAFRKVPYGVVWKSPIPHNPDAAVPSNVKLVKWIPQQELLADPRVKCFITHAGMNSQFEALYYGVPMISFPQFADQVYNAARAKHRGFGITIQILKFSSDELVNGIQEILTNQKYSRSIQKASVIYRNRPISAKEKTIYWLENILEHGGDHLRSSALDMPWWKYLMLDILCFLVLTSVVIIKATTAFIKFILPA